jgi:hypothetical protein
MNPREAHRERRIHRQRIAVPIDKIFPLICPVREVEWLAGFDFTMIHSASGLAEKGAVFLTDHSGEPSTIWTISRHDPGAKIVEFTCVTPGSRVRVLEIALKEAENGTEITCTADYTTLGPAGETFLKDFSPEAYQAAMSFMDRSLEHYCLTGKQLPPEHQR